MKRLMMLLLVTAAIPATAYAAISSTGGGTTIANGQATLVSDGTNPYSYISFNDLNAQSVGSLTELAASVVSADYGGGAPRFSVTVSNGTQTKNIFVYLGTLPNLTTGGTGDTGNLLDDSLNGARVDSTQVGGPYYGTWAQATSAASGSGYSTIAGISFVVDAGWAQTDGSQTVVLDGVSINNEVYTFSAAAKSDCKDGNWQLYGYKNQGDCVSFVMASK
jgi:hypothetical protein